VVHTLTAEETEAFGARLASARPEGRDLFGVIYLTGDLGAGKTTLTRGFLRALGITGAVRSPTYTLVEVYEVAALTAVHLDLYRLRDPSELDNLGLREWARPGHIWLVEWPERGSDRLPSADLVVRLMAGINGHDIEVRGHSGAGSGWVERLVASAPAGPPSATS
ncbi:MAG TPA: tRNA (adenosine(37)-N6)-threonylcarbamoyltransferase complex ATPase subunit type 1 TsaE, partial [Steroidobacteraceae bacterium]